MRKYAVQPLAEINITNLVDVAMTLLIIFMITAPMIQSGVKLDLPKMQSDAQTIQEGVLISYTAEDQIYINGILVNIQDFENRLIKAWVQSGRKPVFLSADRDIPYGKIVSLIDHVKIAGIDNLGLVVETEKSSR